MREWILEWLEFDEWQRKIESEVGLCKIQIQDAARSLQNENQFLRAECEHLRAENAKLLEMLERKSSTTQEGPRKLTLRQEIAERTRMAFEEDAKRGATK